jgi:hypothetical protein
MPTDFTQHLMQQPLWVQVWVAWMALVNLASACFLRRTEARIVLGAFAGSFVFMNALFALNGFNRLLGLSHAIFWTPLLVYLLRRRSHIESQTPFGRWVRVLIATNALSLVIDYTDVLRYLLGDRS